VDGSSNSKTNNYQFSVTGATAATLTYDENGNMTSDGTNTYSWDAENRLIRITYPGTGNNSQFTYDALGHTVKIVEFVSGSVTGTKQFIWCGDLMCEARNAGDSLLNQYFSYGQTISGSNYFYTKDAPPGSVRELTDSSGNIQAQYSYDPYGRVTQLQGSLASDFQYAGYYFHAQSGLCLAVHRGYNSSLGRWLSRDPVTDPAFTLLISPREFSNRSPMVIHNVNGREASTSPEINLYAYVANAPLLFNDPSGLKPKCAVSDECREKCNSVCSSLYDYPSAAWLTCMTACLALCKEVNALRTWLRRFVEH
jgi:RHS repeat-associated protein